MKTLVNSFIRYWQAPPAPPVKRIKTTSVRIECSDCDSRTLMTVNGTCATCGGRSFVNSATAAALKFIYAKKN